jgi:hypothetical protein
VARWLLFGTLALVAMAIGFVLYQSDTYFRQASFVAGDTTSRDRLIVSGDLLTADPNRFELTVRLTFEPQGSLLAADGRSLSRDLKLTVNAATGAPDRLLPRDRPPAPTDVTISLYDGEPTEFPFDSYQGFLQLAVTEGPNGPPVPLQLNFGGGLQGLVVHAEPEGAALGVIGVGFRLSRSLTTIGFAVFVMLVQWALALVVIQLVRSVLSGERKVELAMFTWLGAMLFAFPALRGAAPGSPPIGALSDYLAFFWAESIVAVALVLIVSAWLRQKPSS